MAVIAIIGAGAMGSAIGARLVESGARVLSYLEGRSVATVERAKAAGMEVASLNEIIAADLVLSIVPPADAVSVAESLSAAIETRSGKVTFVDCNAISPNTMQQVVAAFSPGQADVLDGSIVGSPPKPGQPGPRLYISGDPDNKSGVLGEYGLMVRRIDGAVGAASALKMCYAGINKGVAGLGTAMMLAAIRSGADQSLRQEMAESQPDLSDKLSRAIPDMYPKAYRWVAEMEEIAAFLGPDDPASLIFKGMAGLFQKMAEDEQSGGELAAELNRMIGSA